MTYDARPTLDAAASESPFLRAVTDFRLRLNASIGPNPTLAPWFIEAIERQEIDPDPIVLQMRAARAQLKSRLVAQVQAADERRARADLRRAREARRLVRLSGGVG